MSIAYQTALIETLNDRVATRQQAIDLKSAPNQPLRRQGELQRSHLARLRQAVDRDRRRDASCRAKRPRLCRSSSPKRDKRKASQATSAPSARQGDRTPRQHKLYAPIDGIVQQLS